MKFIKTYYVSSTSSKTIQKTNLAEFIKEFIKLEDKMCELNYKGTKIKIRVKLWDQKYNFTYKNEAFTGNHSDIDT